MAPIMHVILVSQLASWWLLAQSATKDYTRAEHKLQSTSKSFIPQVIYARNEKVTPTGSQQKRQSKISYEQTLCVV